MSDSDQPKRGRGRPRVNPVEGNRRNVTLQVSSELYETLKAVSEQSGISISREMEQRVQNSFTQRDIIAAAAEGAARAATERMDQQYLEFFGGHDGLTWGKSSADIYAAVFLDLAKERGLSSVKDITDDFRSALVARMKERQDEVSDLWFKRVQMSQIMGSISSSDINKGLDLLFSANPDLKSRLEKKLSGDGGSES